MAGKVIDTQMMESMFSATATYKSKVLNIADEISIQVKVLNDPSLLDGLRGGQGDVAITAIKDVVRAAQDLATKARTICKFIDSKLESSKVLNKKDVGFTAAGQTAKNSTANIKK